MTYPLSASFCTRFNVPKPSLPYFIRNQLTVHSHHPPALTVGSCGLNPDSAYERQSKHPLERCLLHPPLSGSKGPHTVRLRIAGAVRVEDNQNAQLAAVHVLEATPSAPCALPTNVTILAKFYDPL